jgi:hypothetical protein
MKYRFFTLLLILGSFGTTYAGNPDRQGQAGASELLMNPWGRSAGLHSMSTSFSRGVEAMRINIAGLSRINKMEIGLSNNRLFSGSGMNLNSLGFGIRMGKNGALGIELASLDFGDIQITTNDRPSGTGGSYSPGFFQLGVGYSYTYANKISVGALIRGVSESVVGVRSTGFAIDAGVQYVSGDKENFKLGIALRNIGSPMQFGGEGLTVRKEQASYELAYDLRAATFELPSMLNIGLSYDFYITDDSYVRGLGNFTSNAFSRDQVGVGAEFNFRDMVTLRGAYKLDLGDDLGVNNLYTGLSAGVSFDWAVSKDGSNTLGIDYAYRDTSPFKGTHNITFRYGL